MRANERESIIRIKELQVYAYHGVYPEETRQGQNFFVNAELQVNTEKAGATDGLEDTVNYAEVCVFINRWMVENTCQLLEAVAERLGKALLLQFPLVSGVLLEIRKPEAPIGLPFESVSVEVYQSWKTAYIAFGSNLGDRGEYLQSGIAMLADDDKIRMEKQSSILETKPYGVTEQPNFLNGALRILTLYSPEELLKRLHEVEAAANRKREKHWGPRTLDLDILFYEDCVYESDDLIIPHIDLQNRYFVLKPMCEIAPRLVHPILKKTMEELLTALPTDFSNGGDEV